MSSCSIQDQDKRLQALFGACEKLPAANNANFKWVAFRVSLLSCHLAFSRWATETEPHHTELDCVGAFGGILM